MDDLQLQNAVPADQSTISDTKPAEAGPTPASPAFSVPADNAAEVAQPEAKPAAAPAPAAPEAVVSLTEANKLMVCCKALKNIEREVANIIRLLESNNLIPTGAAAIPRDAIASAPKDDDLAAQLRPVDGRVTEGVFDGQNMVGSNGKIYTVPANYASKSKLVEGDLLKLTITPRGSFIYKQIGPIERSRVIAALGFDPTIGEFYATTENRRWSVLKASVTYFKGEPGDEVVLLVPKNAPSKWAAVENIIKRNPLV